MNVIYYVQKNNMQKKKKNANLVSSKHWTQNNIVQPKTNKLNGLALHQFVLKKINV